MKLLLISLFISTICLGQTPEKVAADKLADREYVTNQIDWVKIYMDAEIRAIREAVNKVETTNSNYRESQNEWRGQIKDQTGTFVTRRELIGWIGAVIGVILGAIPIISNYMKGKNAVK